MNDDDRKLNEGFKKTDLDWIERNDPLYTDPLTNGFNRVAYDVFLPRLIDEARTLKIPLTLAILDLDSFRLVNDTYGYEKGDQKIKEVALKLKPHIRQTDYLFRYMGDEFIIVFRDSEADGVNKIIMPRIRNALGAIGLQVSTGTAELQKSDDAKSFFERAEKLMREEKTKKKNV